MSYAPEGGSGQHGYGAAAPEPWPQTTAPSAPQPPAAPAPMAPAQSTVVRPYVSPAADYTTTYSPKSSGSKGGRIALIVVGVLVLLGAAGAAATLFLPRGVIDDVIAMIRGEQGRELTATAGAEWETVPVLAGTGQLSYDPYWSDALDLLFGDDAASELSESTGGAASLDGAWVTDGDVVSGGVILMAFSVTGAATDSDPLQELEDFASDATVDGESLTTVSLEPVRTSEGLSGYIGQYDLDILGEAMTVNMGILVEGSDQVYVYTVGNVEYTNASHDLEAVLNSLTIG